MFKYTVQFFILFLLWRGNSKAKGSWFTSSGFLIGYNYYNASFEYTYKSPFTYAYKHLRSFYPYYLLNLFYGLYLNKDSIKFDLTHVELLLINLLLITNRSNHRGKARFYFGISWFLDNIFYCYFISPFLLFTITINSVLIYPQWFLLYK